MMRHKLKVLDRNVKSFKQRSQTRELGVSHETVRQYLKVHEGAPEAGVARETTTVKKVAEFGELFDKGQTRPNDNCQKSG
jgi:predicted transcriptional regulator